MDYKNDDLDRKQKKIMNCTQNRKIMNNFKILYIYIVYNMSTLYDVGPFNVCFVDSITIEQTANLT